MKRTSSRDLSIGIDLEKLFVEVRRIDEGTRKGLVGLVGQRGEVKDAGGASTRLAVLFSFVCTASEMEIISRHRFVLLSTQERIPASSLFCIMSRTGRGGRGGFGGRSSLGASNPPPMGLTFADIQAMSREQSALYPVRPCPLLSTFILTALRNAFPSLSSLFPH